MAKKPKMPMVVKVDPCEPGEEDAFWEEVEKEEAYEEAFLLSKEEVKRRVNLLGIFAKAVLDKVEDEG